MILVFKQRVSTECVTLVNCGFSLFDHLYVVVFLNVVMQKCYNKDQSLPESMISISEIIARENRRDNQKRTIQRNRQNSVHRTTKTKQKTQHNMCWTPPQVNKHKQCRQDTSPPTNKWRKRRIANSFHRLFGLSDMYNLYICFVFNL